MTDCQRTALQAIRSQALHSATRYAAIALLADDACSDPEGVLDRGGMLEEWAELEHHHDRDWETFARMVIDIAARSPAEREMLFDRIAPAGRGPS